jgi:hypothetical protein
MKLLQFVLCLLLFLTMRRPKPENKVQETMHNLSDSSVTASMRAFDAGLPKIPYP